MANAWQRIECLKLALSMQQSTRSWYTIGETIEIAQKFESYLESQDQDSEADSSDP